MHKYMDTEPSHVDGQTAIVTEFYKDRLYTMVKGCFEVECPTEWDKDYMLNMLIRKGYFIISDSAIGIKPFRCSLHGINYMNLPTKAKVALPIISSFEKTLDEDCILIYLERKFERTFTTYEKIVTYYATKLAMCDISININLMNTRLAHLIEVESEAQSATVKNAYDNISEGNPLVVVRKDTLAGTGANALFNSVQNSYIVNDIQDSKRSIINEFLTAIGINNANTDKKERVIESEVSSNNEELVINTEVFNVRLKEQSKKVRDMFGIDFNMKLKFDSRTRAREENGNDINGRGSSLVKNNRKESE